MSARTFVSINRNRQIPAKVIPPISASTDRHAIVVPQIEKVFVISQKDLITNCPSTLNTSTLNKRVVEHQLNILYDTLNNEPRMKGLITRLNLEKWVEFKKGPPTLIFNLDSSYRLYRNHPNVIKIVNNHVFHLFQGKKIPFNIERRVSHADHLSENQVINSIGLKRVDGSAQQINVPTHVRKTDELDMSFSKSVRNRNGLSKTAIKHETF